MSLKEDMEFLSRAIDQGKGKEFIEGTYSPGPEPMPLDESVNGSSSLYTWMRKRGD